MAKTYADIQKEIASLEKTAETLKQQEMAGVIERIKSAISTYGLSAADLGLRKQRPAAVEVKRGRKPRAKPGSVMRFLDDAGNSWSGRGRRPGWYLAALAAGKTPDDLKA